MRKSFIMTNGSFIALDILDMRKNKINLNFCCGEEKFTRTFVLVCGESISNYGVCGNTDMVGCKTLKNIFKFILFTPMMENILPPINYS